jgi:thiamine biosynthesis lipoprotein
MTAAMTRSVHVEHCMGTVFTLDIRDSGQWGEAMRDAVTWLHHVDAVFSTYQHDSDISRIRRGELRVVDADPDVATVLELCVQVQEATGGAFSALRGGRLDPTGLVKGWAVERASRILQEHGARNHAVNGGGDMQLAGEAASGRPWAVGIADPHDRTRVLTVVRGHGRGHDIAVATSGVAERGAHIVNPFTAAPATNVASATVLGPSLTLADAYATAAVVLDRGALAWIEDLPGYEALLVTADGALRASTGWHHHIDPDPTAESAGTQPVALATRTPPAHRHAQVIGRSVAGTHQVHRS